MRMTPFDAAWMLLKEEALDPSADPEGPLAQEMRDMRARKQPQKPLELPGMQRMRSMTQSKLPEELTEGAHESPFKLGE
tara:strand:- start:11098 stop:11334 length:237 start_codon:yes stop_codon:yes gene_type:complete